MIKYYKVPGFDVDADDWGYCKVDFDQQPLMIEWYDGQNYEIKLTTINKDTKKVEITEDEWLVANIT